MSRLSARFFAVAIVVTIAISPAAAKEMWVFFGTHVDQPGHGFFVARFDTRTGALTKPEFLLQAAAPAFFVIDPDGKHLYTANSLETYNGQPTGLVSAYKVDPVTARLTLLNQQPSGGADPSYVSLDKTGRYLFVANYNGATIAAFALNPDGSIGNRTAFIQHTGKGVNPTRQTQAHPHSIRVDPTNHFAFVPDLGLDKIFVYRFDARDGSLTPNDPPFASVAPGSGPRHLDFDPAGRFAYVLNEMASKVTVFAWDSTHGVLTEVQTISSLPAGFTGTSAAAEIRVHPTGRFLYCTNRGDNSIAVFAVDAASGRLSLIEHVSTQGKMPRNFEFDPTGHWLLVSNHDSDNALVFKIHLATGKLTPQGTPVSLPLPFCERFLPVASPGH
ncbi:MAG: lactonase family protein [Candidatus Acidiferrales bacterium]